MNFSFSFFKTTRGQTLIELVLVMGLAAIMLPALMTGLIASRNGKPQQSQRMQGVTVLKETEAAVRNIRSSNWAAISSLTTNTPYHTALSSSQWTLIAGAYTDSNGITQTIVASDVKRDTNGAIVQSGGTLDPSTKKITTTISWTKPIVSSISSDMYIANTKNASKTQTTNTDFNAGTHSSTIVTNSAGGEVTLDPSVGAADWCRPQDSIVETLTLPKKGNSISAPAVGSAYIATGDGTAGASFVNVGIAYPTPPASPSASVVATYNGNYQTNAVYSDGTYAYLAINGTTKQVRILNIATQPYTEVGTISVTGTNANGVYVSGKYAYVTSDDKIYKVDVTTKSGSHTPSISKQMNLEWFEPTVTAKQVVVTNNHVFVTVQGALAGLQVFKTSDLTLTGVAQPSYKVSPQGLYVNTVGTRAYVAFSGGTGAYGRGFFIVNTYEPESLWFFVFYLHYVVGSYNTGTTDPRGMAIAPPANSNRALIGGLGGTEYQVINIANEGNPTYCGGLDIPAGVTGVTGALDQYANAYSFLLTGEVNDQFKMIKGGAGGGGGGYAATGTFESSTIDATSSAVFNRFTANVNQPANTTIKMQVGVATIGGSGTCTDAQFTYVGPNGATSTYFTPNGNAIAGAIPVETLAPFYQNPAQCFRYKVYFTNTASATPTLYDVTVNYSP